MRVFSLVLVSGLLVSSCSSIDQINKNPNCVVWKDQKFFGPASVEVISKKVSWIGGCRGLHWDCKALKLTSDDGNNVMAEEIPMGFIENNRFSFFPDHPFGDYVSSAEYVAVPESQEVRTPQTVYRFNQKCSADEAILGALAVDIIGHIQKAKN